MFGALEPLGSRGQSENEGSHKSHLLRIFQWFLPSTGANTCACKLSDTQFAQYVQTVIIYKHKLSQKQSHDMLVNNYCTSVKFRAWCFIKFHLLFP